MRGLAFPSLITPPVGPADAARVERLIIARQSGTGAWEDLRKMLERILTANSSVPGYRQLRDWGLTPLDDEEQFGERWAHTGGTRAVLYSAEGTYVLLVLGSLTARNVAVDEASDMEDNFVVSLYGQVLRSLRPRYVITGPFDRIVRAYEFGPETYRNFLAAGVEYLFHDGGDLEFGTDVSESEWESLSVEAAAALRITRRRLLQGQMSTVRDNGWPLSGWQAPPGMTRLEDGTLGVDEVEASVVRAVAEMVAEPGFAISDIASGLAEAAPRRRGTEGVRKRRGVEFATSPLATRQRARKFVERVMIALPDLAMGKYVAMRRTPHSFETVFVGARRERSADCYAHWLMWSVPDLFNEMDEAVLLEAVTACAAYRVSRGLPGSQYVAELQHRERIRQLVATDVDSVESREAKRWAGPSGRMVNAMGQSEPELPRSPFVREAIEHAAERTHRRAANSQMQSLFAKWPTWRQEDAEYLLTSGISNNSYALLCRPADANMSPRQSARRAWGIKKGVGDRRILAQMPVMSFHEAIARAVAAALTDGVPVLRGRHYATAHIHDASRERRLERVANRQRLENDLQAATDRADAALEMALNAAQRRRAAQRTAERIDASESEGSVATIHTDMTASKAMVDVLQRKADDAFAKVELARQRIAAFEASAAGASQAWAAPNLDDMDLVLETLVQLATRRVASPKECRVFQGLIVDLKVKDVGALEVKFSFNVRLPGVAGQPELTVGPVQATVPSHGYRRTGNVSQPHAYAEAYCLRGELPEHSPTSRNGKVEDPQRQVRRTIVRFFSKEHALAPSSATTIVDHPLPLVRATAFRLLADGERSAEALGISADYLALFIETYMSAERPPSISRDRGAGARYRQQILDILLQQNDASMRISQLVREIAQTLPSKTDRQRDNALRARLDQVPERWDRPWSNIEQASVKALECPHCSTADGKKFLDIVAWLPEVPGGLLCSRCLRCPREDSIVYPVEYRALHTRSVSSRRNSSKPSNRSEAQLRGA